MGPIAMRNDNLNGEQDQQQNSTYSPLN